MKKNAIRGIEAKEPTQKVVEYLDGLTIDGKSIEFVSDVKASPISENYIEVKLTFIAGSYDLLPYKFRNGSSDSAGS